MNYHYFYFLLTKISYQFHLSKTLADCSEWVLRFPIAALGFSIKFYSEEKESRICIFFYL